MRKGGHSTAPMKRKYGYTVLQFLDDSSFRILMTLPVAFLITLNLFCFLNDKQVKPRFTTSSHVIIFLKNLIYYSYNFHTLFICFHTHSDDSTMLLYAFHTLSYAFHTLSYAFYMLSYAFKCFYMLFHSEM